MKRSTNSHLKSRAWAAIFALLIQALLPTVVYAGAPKGSYLSEVCTAFGIKKVAVPAGDPAGIPSHGQHCPVCSVAHLLALPTSFAGIRASAVAAFEIPQLAASQEYAAIRLSPYLRGPPLPL